MLSKNSNSSIKIYLGKFLNIMTIDDDRVEPEGVKPLAVGLHVVLQRGGVGLTETVHVEDNTEVGQVVVAGKVKGFPH